MYEVELKVRAAHEPVREALAARDATRLGAVRQDDTYYDAPHRSFAATDEALRLRHETDEDAEASTTHLTYKGPLVDTTSKTREEAETAVTDPEATASIVEALGFSPAASVTKHRERFALGEYTVALDSVTDVGQFVEIERTVETEAEIDAARDGARERLADLGLDPDDQLRTSYLALVLDARETADGHAEGTDRDNRG